MKKSRQEIESELRSLVPQHPSDRLVDAISTQLDPKRTATGWQQACRWGRGGTCGGRLA